MSTRRAFTTTSAALKAIIWADAPTTKDVSWVRRAAESYMDQVVKIDPKLKSDVAKLQYGTLHGDPHESEYTFDPFHGSTKFASRPDFGGSTLSVHVYPDGTCKPSKGKFPTLKVAPATAEELGDDSKWLDKTWVSKWKDWAKLTFGKKKGESSKKPGKGSSSKGSSSKPRGESSSSQRWAVDDHDRKYRWSTSKNMYVYFDDGSGAEYYIDEQGAFHWI